MKFKVGDKVRYIIAGQESFRGTITKVEVKRGKKPYTGVKDNGDTFFANEEFLFSL